MNPEYRPVSFNPGDEVPEWAVDQVGDHVLEPEETADSDQTDTFADSGLQDQEQDIDSGADDEADGDSDEDDSNPPVADDQPDFTAPAPARRRGRTQK
jgi:hypothetical protein